MCSNVGEFVVEVRGVVDVGNDTMLAKGAEVDVPSKSVFEPPSPILKLAFV